MQNVPRDELGQRLDARVRSANYHIVNYRRTIRIYHIIFILLILCCLILATTTISLGIYFGVPL